MSKVPKAKNVEPDYFYLAKASISNIGPIKKSSVSFKNGLNIVIGRNGVGKTIFFENTYKLLNMDARNAFRSNVDASFSIAGSRTIDITYKKRVKKADLDGLDIKIPKPSLSVKYLGKTYDRIDDFLELHPAGGLYNILFVRHGVPVNNMPIVSKPFDITLDKDYQAEFLSNLGYSSNAVQENPYFIGSLIRSIDLSLLITNDESKEGNTRGSVTEQIQQAIANGCQPLIDELNEYLPRYSAIKAVRVSESVNIHHDSSKDTSLISNLYFEYLVNGDWLTYTSLSDGTKRVFYIIAEVLSTYSSFNFPGSYGGYSKNPPKIIIIEEPELGIHPHQYHDLLDFINEQSKQQQIIIISHSPQTLDILERDELDRLLICSFDKELGTVFNHLNASEKKKALMYMDDVHLSEYWRVSDLEKDAD